MGDIEVGLIAFSAVAFAVWFAVFGIMLQRTRPTAVRAASATQDLPGDEPPAVVSFLANRWRITEDAVESTVLDLAARRWIELRQPGNDPLQTTVHVLDHLGSRPPGEQADLLPYEQQVLSRVRAEARDGVVPITALTFRDHTEATRWNSQFASLVITDARERGLSRRRFSPALVGALGTLALFPAAGVGLVVAEANNDLQALIGFGVAVFAGLTTLAGRPLGERDTDAGREVARGWFGVRDFLRNDEVFAELPPYAVAVWDRYLSYGDALGATQVCARVLDLGMGDRKRVWSSYTGGWRRVRVRYPRFWGRYGETTPRIVLPAGLQAVAGGWVVKTFNDGFPLSFGSSADKATTVVVLLGLLLLVRGLYRVTRALLDLASPITRTGEVLWVERWKSRTKKDETVPLVDYLALDDGTADRTTAWAVPSDWAHRVRPGDVARIEVRPWSRRITQLEVSQVRPSAD